MFNALKSLDLTALPEEVQTAIRAAQHEALDVAMQSANLKPSAVHLTESNAALATQNAEFEAVNARLEHYVKELHQLIYGKRSEKLTEDERQLAFEDLEVATAKAEAQSDAIEMTKPRKKRKRAQRNLGNLPGHLERIEQVVEPDSITCPCGCGDMVRIGEDRTERLDIVPAQFRVIVTVRPIYACPNKDGGVAQARSSPVFDRRRAAHRGTLGLYGRVQIRRSLPIVPTMSDIRPLRHSSAQGHTGQLDGQDVFPSRPGGGSPAQGPQEIRQALHG